MPAIRNTKSNPSHSAGPSADPASPKAAEAGAKVHKKYHTGDFTITASDGTIFRLPSYHMLSVSAVLRDAHNVSTNGNSELDLDVGAKSIALWLDIIVTRMTPRVADYDADSIEGAICLCDKFDCPGVRENLLSGLETAIESKPANVLRYMLATAAIGEARLFEKCVRGSTELSFCESPQTGGSARLHCLSDSGRPVRDLSTWSLQNFRRLPVDYIWATIRSYGLYSESSNRQVYELKELLAAIEGQNSARDPAPATTSATT